MKVERRGGYLQYMRKKKTSSPAKQLHIYIYICGGKLLGCSAGVQIREVLALYPYLGLESRPLDSSPPPAALAYLVPVSKRTNQLLILYNYFYCGYYLKKSCSVFTARFL